MHTAHRLGLRAGFADHHNVLFGLQQLPNPSPDELVVVEQKTVIRSPTAPVSQVLRDKQTATLARHQRGRQRHWFPSADCLDEVTPDRPTIAGPRSLRQLLDAVQTSGPTSTWPVMLQRIIRSAADLVDARYGTRDCSTRRQRGWRCSLRDALSNVAKHAAASGNDVEIDLVDDAVFLWVPNHATRR